MLFKLWKRKRNEKKFRISSPSKEEEKMLTDDLGREKVGYERKEENGKLLSN